jgi:hypothetical protein
MYGGTFTAAGTTNCAYYGTVAGAQLGVALASGASVRNKAVIELTYGAGSGVTDGSRGSTTDAHIFLSAGTTPASGGGSTVGIQFGASGGVFPVATTGTLIQAAQTATVQCGIDLHQMTFTSGFATAIYLPNGSTGGISFANNSGNLLAGVINIGSNNYLNIGTNTSGVSFGASITPGSDNTYSCGASGSRWSLVWAASGTIQTSDVSAKSNIVDELLGLAFINALHPVIYDWNGADGEGHHGFVAQEIEATLGETPFGGLHKPGGPSKYYGLDYAQLLAPVVKSIQELDKKVEELRAAKP